MADDGCGSGVTSTCVTAATSSIVTSEHASFTFAAVPEGASVPAAADPAGVEPLALLLSPPHADSIRIMATDAVAAIEPTVLRIGGNVVTYRASVLSLLDWRRQVADLYAEVRRIAAVDPRHAHALWCERRNDLYAHHEQSPVVDRSTFGGLWFFPYDPAWRVEAPVQRAPAQRLVVQSGTGEDFTLDRVGVIAVPGGVLDVHWIDVYGGGVFLPVRDATSGTVTYGGGRYVLDTVKGADLGGDLIVDLNFAYSPSCAFDPRWSCPLAPPGNRLDVAVEAGEKAP